MAATPQPNGLPSILQPEKGVASKGFNLHAVMGLDDNQTLSCTLHVSFLFYYPYLV